MNCNEVLKCLKMPNYVSNDFYSMLFARSIGGGAAGYDELTGTPPLTFTANGENLLDYRIYGANDGVGERTENLFNGRGKNHYGYYDNASGEFVDDRNYKHWKFSVEEGDIVRWTTPGAGYGCYWSNGVYRGRFKTNTPFVVPADVDEITNNFDSSVWDSAMVTKNQPLPAAYIPFGYQINAEVGDGVTTTDIPIYIGSDPLAAIGEYSDYVDYHAGKIARKIKKQIFTGGEEWREAGSAGSGRFFITVENGINSVWGTTRGFSRCSHYTPSMNSQSIGEYNLGGLTHISSTRWNQNIIFSTGLSSMNEFKSYLSSQYEDGTPVTVWYVVEVPAEQDPPVELPALPTIDGATIVDFDNEPKPSEMYIKYPK